MYHHIGLPAQDSKANERFLPALGAYASRDEADQFGIEWWRFAPDAPVPDLLREVAHVCFEVADLSQAIAGKDMLLDPVELEPGVTAAFVQFDGFPILFIEIGPKADGCWASRCAFEYHSVWQPRSSPHEKDVHLEDLKMYAAQHENEYGIGWVRYYDDAPYPDIVKRLAHVVFEVPDIQKAMTDRKVIIPANNPDAGLWVGFVEENGAPVEFIEVDRNVARAGV